MLLGIAAFLAYRAFRGGQASSTSAAGGLTPDAQTGVVSALQAAMGALANQNRPGGTGTSSAAPGSLNVRLRGFGGNPLYGGDQSGIPSIDTGAGGVAIRDAAGKLLGFLPFGSSIAVNPTPQLGPSNRGTNLWYWGYLNGQRFLISAFDLFGLLPEAQAAAESGAASPDRGSGPVGPPVPVGAGAVGQALQGTSGSLDFMKPTAPGGPLGIVQVLPAPVSGVA